MAKKQAKVYCIAKMGIDILVSGNKIILMDRAFIHLILDSFSKVHLK
jgi:hypothetical protein